MSEFKIKITPKDKPESLFSNMIKAETGNYNLAEHNNKIVFSNRGRPGQHIYEAYVVGLNKEDKYIGFSLSTRKASNGILEHNGLFTLQDIPTDALIIYYEQKPKT